MPAVSDVRAPHCRCTDTRSLRVRSQRSADPDGWPVHHLLRPRPRGEPICLRAADVARSRCLLCDRRLRGARRRWCPARGHPWMTPRFSDALPVWTKIGLLSFGGPAGQIALMQDEVVTRRGWVPAESFDRGLAFSMMLPGPEAQQLATLAWLASARTVGRPVRGPGIRCAGHGADDRAGLDRGGAWPGALGRGGVRGRAARGDRAGHRGDAQDRGTGAVRAVSLGAGRRGLSGVVPPGGAVPAGRGRGGHCRAVPCPVRKAQRRRPKPDPASGRMRRRCWASGLRC